MEGGESGDHAARISTPEAVRSGYLIIQSPTYQWKIKTKKISQWMNEIFE